MADDVSSFELCQINPLKCYQEQFEIYKLLSRSGDPRFVAGIVNFALRGVHLCP